MLLDDTGSIRLTLWGQKANLDFGLTPIVAAKAVKVGEYNGLTLSTVVSSQVVINPEIAEAYELGGWYEKFGKDLKITAPRKEERRLIQEVRDGELEYSLISATVIFVKEDSLWYDSCPGEGCNKKVVLEENGMYRCERCNKSYDKCNTRYMLTLHVGDFTGQIWITLFDDTSASVLGLPAEELKKLGGENSSQLQSTIKKLYQKELYLKIRSREDTYNNEVKMRYNVLNLNAVDYLKESKGLISLIDKCQL
jgi:replication factor A1